MLVLASGVLIAIGAVAAHASLPVWSRVAYAAAIAIAIGQPLERSWRSIRRRRLDINTLMTIAVAGAIALGDWIEAASVVWLFALAEWLEAKSLERADRTIRSLVTLAPDMALVRRNGHESEIQTSQVVPGDIVIVRPGGRIPVDGVVLSGETAIDESSVTGESWPVEKARGDAVLAGTLNGNGAFELDATHPAIDSTLARIQRLVEQARSNRGPTELLIDRFAARYTPAVVVLAVALAVIGPLATAGNAGWAAEFGTWSYRALALLVVACPCALVISTPVSMVSALTAAARQGVLIKGGAHLERIGRVTCVAFDKTGTLTDGRLAVQSVVPLDGASAHGVLTVAAALESRSEHPIGRAIVDYARADGVTVAPGERFRALPGLGAEAVVAASPAIVGSHRLFEDRRLCTPSLHQRIDEVEGRGHMPVLVGYRGAPLGVISFSDRLRDSGRRMMAGLRREGIQRVVILTGDRDQRAKAAGRAAGLDEAHGDLLPADKVAHIARLRKEVGPVAMVGDGVNDAPALAAADVGIAMGGRGATVALETADVALVSDDLSKLPYAFSLGRATISKIRVNFAAALILKLAFVGLAAAGVATLWMAVVADSGASLLVTANSLRLLRKPADA
jgi:Cd2+/Zn2+-exporting ATPase